jgi:ribonuclease P protein component
MRKVDFSKRFRSGKRLRGKVVALQYGSSRTTKIAVVVQARAVPGAVERNRIRRQLYAHVATLVEAFTRPIWVAIIVHTKPGSIVAARDELSDLLRKSGIIEV